ncbi:glycine/sarcosine/betaine reductase component B subunit [Paraclostridium sp. AKS81]|uniref:glycine/sarcosine/betaine reductase component B subunit n=1 Tax=Paraclostridium sp. AKS81 TaxID=2876117 RepID=UPI002FCCF7BD
MKLEIGNFYVKSIEFSNKTSYENGILRLNKEELLNFIKEDERITDADLHIVNPGEMIRLCPVKEAIEPRVKVDNRALFPGFTGDLENCGHGKTHALKDCSVLVVGKHWGGFQDGLIDMGGEGAKYTYFSKIKNIVLVADTNEDFEKMNSKRKMML